MALTPDEKKRAALDALESLTRAVRECPADSLCRTLHELRTSKSNRRPAEGFAAGMSIALEIGLSCR